MNLPLDGLIVADFSRVLAGPLATTMLADLGATVIKVERPEVGDETRHWGPPWTQLSSSYYESANRTKSSVELDLSRGDDAELARRLAARADVLVENFRPGRLHEFGLGYDEVREENPRIVYCSISGFGSKGGAELAGYDFIAQAVGGLMSITGAAEGDPTKVGVAVVDVLTSKDALSGILAALLEREKSGHGQHIEVNLLSSLLGSLVNQAAAQLATGVAPQRMGNRHPSVAPYQTFHCRDGLIVIACGNDAQFRRLAETIQRPGLADDPRFANNSGRVEHGAELSVVLEEALAAREAEYWQSALNSVGVPAGTVGDIASAFARATELGLDPVVDMGPGAIGQVRHPVTYSRTVPTPPTRPPRLGEHNIEIRRWLAREESAP